MILLGLGSNLSSRYGDRFKNIDIALSTIEKHEIRVIKKSSYFESFSYPNKKDPKFINVVVQVESLILPEKLASILLSVEESLDRKRNKKNDPRTCDIDILDFNGQILNFKYNDFEFVVPHKKLIYRNFVLFPLNEIAPKWIHPETKDSINSLIEKLSTEDKKSILKIKKP
tara:strand:+ start:4601 stop:5113 length:513 start_codon:yes stop_codon:yes gene_type:complete